jgi:hypothetical protein
MKKLKEEFFKILPPTIYFFVALHLVMFIRVLMLEGTGLAPSSSISIAVAALILGKAVLLADMLPIINRFPAKPLIYNIAWKTVIYLLISPVLHYLERLIDFWRQTGGFVAGNEKLKTMHQLGLRLGIFVKDLAFFGQVDFYTQVFESHAITEVAIKAVGLFDNDHAAIRVLFKETHHSTKLFPTWVLGGFYVDKLADDFDSALTELRASDVKFVLEPFESPVCRMAIISDEGGIFDTLAGRYSSTPNLAPYLSGHAGRPIAIERQNASHLGSVKRRIEIFH